MQKAETKDTALRRIHTGGGRTGQMSLEPRGKLGEVSWTRKQQNQMLRSERRAAQVSTGRKALVSLVGAISGLGTEQVGDGRQQVQVTPEKTGCERQERY